MNHQQLNYQPLHHANLFTSDLYQFTCSYSYYIANKHQQQATFQVFFRKYPFGGKYVVLGGIRAVKQFLQNLELTPIQQQFLLSIYPHMKKQYFIWLRANLKGRIKVKSFIQGDIVFAKEPLITYTGPISIVQLLQTPILNLIGFASLVATNASRMAKAVQPKNCIEFGIRRAQGPDGALSASQFAYLGGFIGTSNIQASLKLGIPCYGTMSHAYVTSFSSLQQISDYEIAGVNIGKRVRQIKQQSNFKTHEGEIAAFTMYAKSFPNSFNTLIDTYSTLGSGLLNTIIVAKALNQAGIQNFGIRLDSGDLAAQSIKCREIWNQHFPNGPRLKILASDDLHEDRLVLMQQAGHQIDTFAIGTHIATCKKQPALGLVCKLVQLDGQPKMKLSQDGQKATYPSNKTTYRVWVDNSQQSSFDLISLHEQKIQTLTIIRIADPSNRQEIREVNPTKIKLLNDSWQTTPPLKTLQQCKQHFNHSKKQVNKTLPIKNPTNHPVMMTQKYIKLFIQTELKNKVDKEKVFI